MLGLSQLNFDFSALPRWTPFSSVRESADELELPPETAPEPEVVTDDALEAQAKGWLQELGLTGAMKLLSVQWNSRLRSTAGYAHYPKWQIELNPRLREFEGQVERTLKHELAHLIAYHRSGRRRIEPHGPEWRLACAELGIPDESARHDLPVPRKTVTRGLTYECPACKVPVLRVRKFRRPTACLKCCNLHSGGAYDERFKLKLVAKVAGKAP